MHLSGATFFCIFALVPFILILQCCLLVCLLAEVDQPKKHLRQGGCKVSGVTNRILGVYLVSLPGRLGSQSSLTVVTGDCDPRL
jgi:hypothetical protein